jgi:hypothetical protein
MRRTHSTSSVRITLPTSRRCRPDQDPISSRCSASRLRVPFQRKDDARNRRSAEVRRWSLCAGGARLTARRPLFAPGGAYAGKVKLVFRNQVQPWHASSTFVHEAGLAVRTSDRLSARVTDRSVVLFRSRVRHRSTSGRSPLLCARFMIQCMPLTLAGRATAFQ